MLPFQLYVSVISPPHTHSRTNESHKLFSQYLFHWFEHFQSNRKNKKNKKKPKGKTELRGKKKKEKKNSHTLQQCGTSLRQHHGNVSNFSYTHSHEYVSVYEHACVSVCEKVCTWMLLCGMLPHWFMTKSSQGKKVGVSDKVKQFSD